VPPSAAELRRQLRDADGVLICTPEYAGALPGSFKNLLDWTVGGGETYGKPVAWINASMRADGAHESLRAVLGYTGWTSSRRLAGGSWWRAARSPKTAWWRKARFASRSPTSSGCSRNGRPAHEPEAASRRNPQTCLP
jgi:hypothetical protein